MLMREQENMIGKYKRIKKLKQNKKQIEGNEKSNINIDGLNDELISLILDGKIDKKVESFNNSNFRFDESNSRYKEFSNSNEKQELAVVTTYHEKMQDDLNIMIPFEKDKLLNINRRLRVKENKEGEEELLDLGFENL